MEAESEFRPTGRNGRPYETGCCAPPSRYRTPARFRFASPTRILHITRRRVKAIMQLEPRSWRSEMQRRLEREMLATMEVVSGEEGFHALQVTPADDAHSSLHFGSSGSTRVGGGGGLHFDVFEDKPGA